jgi:hypothetical protein
MPKRPHRSEPPPRCGLTTELLERRPKTIRTFPERSHRRNCTHWLSALSPLNREIRRDMVTCSGCLRRLAIDNPGGVDIDIWKDVP